MPKLEFSNTEEKENTLNDDKAFTVARYELLNAKQFVCSSCHFCRRDALYEVSKDTAKDNIYIFEVSPISLSYFFLKKRTRVAQIHLY